MANLALIACAFGFHTWEEARATTSGPNTHRFCAHCKAREKRTVSKYVDAPIWICDLWEPDG